MAKKSGKDTPLKPAGQWNKSNPGFSKDFTSGKLISKGSVNDASTRSGAAPTPKTLGPRTA